MFDDRAPCSRRAQHRFWAVRMHHAAQALGAGFAAGGVELRLRQRRRAAVANAGRRENLDHVGTIGLLLANIVANLLDRPLHVRDRSERSEDARTGQHAARDRVTQRLVRGCANALHGRKAGHQGHEGVFGAIQRRLLRWLRTGVIPALGVEVPADVHVRVDETRQQRQAREIVGDGAAGIADTGDLAVFDGDGDTVDGAASPINHARGADRRGGACLRHRWDGGKRKQERSGKSHGPLSLFVIRYLLFVLRYFRGTEQLVGRLQGDVPQPRRIVRGQRLQERAHGIGHLVAGVPT